MLRYLTAGESHGKALLAIIEGLPAGIKLDGSEINILLERRQGGYGRGGRMSIEKDEVEFISGLRSSYTLGSPLGLLIKNRDWENWQTAMDPLDPVIDMSKRVARPRPGHADLPGGIKYGHKDMRNILERASARETAARVAVGAVAKELLKALGIRVQGHVFRIGGIEADSPPKIYDEKIYDNPFYCSDPRVRDQMKLVVDTVKSSNDSIGGTIRVVAEGVPPGLGSHVHWDRRLDGRLAQAVMSIPGIKAVEFGMGLRSSIEPGSHIHDGISYSKEKGYYRERNNAGGLEGGITNGEPLVIRAAMKAIPTMIMPLQSVDIDTKEKMYAIVERSDICAVPAASIVGEAMVCWVLAEAVMEKFGGDRLEEIVENYHNYLQHVKEF